jgi:thiamine biosynthesis lipoprotein
VVPITSVKRILALALALVLLTGCQPKPLEKKSVVGFYFDTVITLSAFVDDDKVLKEALDECARYEKLFSRTVQGSDIWRINEESGPIQVAPETIEMLSDGLGVSEASGGAFDMTVEPETKLWNFSGETAKLPDAEALKEAATHVDYKKLVLKDSSVELPDDMGLDLGGIAKGYIADKLGEFLRKKGVKSALINLGGNVLTVGRRATDDAAWVVGIQDPKAENGTNKLTLKAEDLSVVTSGNYERFFILDGVRYHHLLNPRTGWPVNEGLDSITILSKSSAMGDALSTACYVLGVDKGMELLKKYDGIDAIFVNSDGSVVMTDGAKALIVDQPQAPQEAQDG